MATGAITEYIDVAQLVLYAFWIFFFGLVIYLRREDKREGYPLESTRRGTVRIVGFPPPPPPKKYVLSNGQGVRYAPKEERPQADIAAKPTAPWPGAPLNPTGNPMIDGVGPAAWADRPDTPDLTHRGEIRIVPMRVATEFSVEPRDPDPRGKSVFGADNKEAAIVVDIWVDRGEPQIRYLEVDTGEKRVLLPITLAKVSTNGQRIKVSSILSHQFADVPVLRNPDQVTLLEEDRICAYYGGGHLYAHPLRTESML